MSTSFPATTSANAPSTQRAAAPTPSEGWIFSPGVDALVIANLAWPLVAWFVMSFAETTATRAFGFLLAFFIIMPHRWITLPLVFMDRQRLAQRPVAFLAVLIGIVLFSSGVTLSLGSLALLIAVDYAWNAWHFASQHAGIGRIYFMLGKPAQAGSGRWEKLIVRASVIFVLARLTALFVPANSDPWLNWIPQVMPSLAWLDPLVLLTPLALLGWEFVTRRSRAIGRYVYLLSLYSLYASMLIAIRSGHEGWTLGCAAAATLFHSTEYLSVVTWSAPKRPGLSESPLAAYALRHWAVSLLGFMAFFAVSAYFFRERYLHAWVWINLNVSLMHYAYDGMIWKRPRKPQSA